MDRHEANDAWENIQKFMWDNQPMFLREQKSLSLVERKERAKKTIDILLDSYGTNKDVSYEQINEFLNNYVDVKEAKGPLSIVEQGVKNWLTSEKKKVLQWPFFQRYKNFLLVKQHWKPIVVSEIDKATDEILGYCGNPKVSASFKIRGLVVGDIQSGKTANYAGLINKAIDAGYKIIVVLAGLTNELRAQTQERLERDVAGKTTLDGPLPTHYGVSEFNAENTKYPINIITTRDQKGDLTKKLPSLYGGEESPANLIVMKKTPSALRALQKFINNQGDCLRTMPVLIIDDEADLASINTRKESNLEASTSTNRLIREALFKCSDKCTYVGYTATPFANIFIQEHQPTSASDTEDLFAHDFIVTLNTPEDYCGPREYFGITPQFSETLGEVKTDLLIEIPENDGRFWSAYHKAKYKDADDTLDILPKSLIKAIDYFLIGSGIKVARGIGGNTTMLVNVNVKVQFNRDLKELIASALKAEKNNFLFSDRKKMEFRGIWEKEFLEKSKKRETYGNKRPVETWSQVEEGIRNVVHRITWDSVKLITGTKDSDKLEYSKDNDSVYVVVGGQKLSRGLTLDGLITSYYCRRAQSSDTLLQMGRWFGYRKDWIDLCRVFTTDDIRNDFLDAAELTEDFKNQVRLMNKAGSTPSEYGYRVRCFDHLLPTAKNKMRNAKEEISMIDYSGTLASLLKFSKQNNAENLNLLNAFIRKLDSSYSSCSSCFPLYKNVALGDVKSFLNSFKEPSGTLKYWKKYMDAVSKEGELQNWTVLVSSLRDEKNRATYDLAEYQIIKPHRSSIDRKESGNDTISIRAVANPEDYLFHFSEEVQQQIGKTPYHSDDDNQQAILQKEFTKKDGIIGIYVFDLTIDENGKDVVSFENVVGLAIWFPKSDVDISSEPKAFWLNPVEQKRVEEERKKLAEMNQGQ